MSGCAAVLLLLTASQAASALCTEAAAEASGSTCSDDSVVLLQTSVQVHSSPQKVVENAEAPVNSTGPFRYLEELAFKTTVRQAFGALPPEPNSRPVYYHLHISKAAGSSFRMDAPAVLWSHGHNFISREGCYYNAGKPSVQVGKVLVLVRNPRSHVLSIYNYLSAYRYGAETQHFMLNRFSLALNRTMLPATFSKWIQSWVELRRSGWAGDFTPPGHRFFFESQAEEDLQWRVNWLYSVLPCWMPGLPRDVPAKDYGEAFGGGTGQQAYLLPFSTWSPMSFQAQRLTCTKPYDYTHPINASKAVRNLQDSYFSGVVEAYQTSMCLLYAKVASELPVFCDCTKPALWATFNGTEAKADFELRPGAVTSPSDFSPETRAAVDELAQEDWEVYRAAWDRLVRESREVEQRFGVKILCNETMPE